MSGLSAEQIAKREKDSAIPFVDLRDGARGILTWAQMDGDELAAAAYELIGEATRIAEHLDEDSRTIHTVIIGRKASQYADQLIHHGADFVYIIEDERLTDYLTLPFTNAMVSVIRDIKPEIALMSASTLGRDLAPRIAGILDLGLSADCTSFEVGYYVNRRKNQRFEKAFKMVRPSFGESKLATIVGPWSYPQMATARPGVFRPLPKDTSRTGKIIKFEPIWKDSDFNVELIESVRNPSNLDLTKADIMIAGGFGVGKEGFEMLKDLVSAINENGQKAELGASRAAVDADFVEYAHQIGQTGKTVRPSIYVAVGISGAIQHLAGMKESSKIFAVNNDHKASIFKNADYGLVMDYQEAIPELIKQVKAGYIFPLDK